MLSQKIGQYTRNSALLGIKGSFFYASLSPLSNRIFCIIIEVLLLCDHGHFSQLFSLYGVFCPSPSNTIRVNEVMLKHKSLFFYCPEKEKIMIYYSICPRSHDPFIILSYYINWAKTSWTDSRYIKTDL